jgi:hypothetical protein
MPDHAQRCKFLGDLFGVRNLVGRGTESVDPLLWRAARCDKADLGGNAEAGKTLFGEGRDIRQTRDAL